MHKVKHTYICDQCGEIQEWASPHDVPMVHISVEPGADRHWNFCTVGCLNEWLKEHNLEGK